MPKSEVSKKNAFSSGPLLMQRLSLSLSQAQQENTRNFFLMLVFKLGK